MTFPKIYVPLIATVLLSACAIDYPTAHRHSVGNEIYTFSYTADIRATHMIKKDSNYWLCVEPAPDAAFSYDDDADLSLITIGQKDGEKIANGTEDLPLSGRTSYLLLARELNYRICEMAGNTHATFDQYFKAYQANLNVIEKVAIAEAPNISHKTNVNISTGVQSAINYNQDGTKPSSNNMSALGIGSDGTSTKAASLQEMSQGTVLNGFTQANCESAGGGWYGTDRSCINITSGQCNSLGGNWDGAYCNQPKTSK